MPSPSPFQLRIELNHVDRALEVGGKLIVDRDPDATPEHVMLRVLAWCLFHEEGLRLADGPPRRDVADLSRTSPDGKAAVWIACAAADGDEIRRLIVHNRGVAVRVLFDEDAPRERFVRQLAGIKKRPPGFEEMELWTIDRGAVTRLAEQLELRQRWAVTLVADHVYIDSDGVKVDSAVTRTPVPPFAS
jgi:uncharacterized protein YaeQ